MCCCRRVSGVQDLNPIAWTRHPKPVSDGPKFQPSVQLVRFQVLRYIQACKLRSELEMYVSLYKILMCQLRCLVCLLTVSCRCLFSRVAATEALAGQVGAERVHAEVGAVQHLPGAITSAGTWPIQADASAGKGVSPSITSFNNILFKQ